MRKPSFHGHHGFHGFHDFHTLIATLLIFAAPFVFLFLVWWMVNEVVSWMWTVVPHPLAWGDWPLHH